MKTSLTRFCPVPPAIFIIVFTGILVSFPAFAGEPGEIPIIPLKRPEKEIVRNMVRIPTGEFIFAKHTKTMNLPEFYIDRDEVTNKKFVEFINLFGNGRIGQGAVSWLDVDSPDCLIERAGFSYRVKSGYEDLPVVEVSWFGARAYAAWQNKRLPTEMEWEKAARGENGYLYPWGQKTPEISTAFFNNRLVFYSNDRSPYGVLNMAGGVWEWCEDLYYPDPFRINSHKEQTTGFADYRVVKGGTWKDLSRNHTTERSFSIPFDRTSYLGFRCAYSPRTPGS